MTFRDIFRQEFPYLLAHFPSLSGLRSPEFPPQAQPADPVDQEQAVGFYAEFVAQTIVV